MSIRFENTCQQDWERMTASENGRYCEHCKKTVYDFTYSTEAEITRVLSASKTVCGRMYDHQMNSGAVIPVTLAPSKRFLAYVSGALLLFGIKEGHAAIPMEHKPATEQHAVPASGLSTTKEEAYSTDARPHGYHGIGFFPRSVKLFKTKKRQFYLGWRFPFLFSTKRYIVSVHLGSMRFLD